MRVLFLITRAHEGGAQEHVLTLIRGLADHIEPVLATGEHGYLTEAAAKLGVPVHTIADLGHSIRPASDYRAGRQIVDLIRRIQPDLIHTHSFKSGLLGRIAARLTQTPAIFTAHGWAFADGVPPAQKALSIPAELLLSKVSGRIITVSEADRRQALRYGVADAPKMVTVLNGVDYLPESPARDCRRVPRAVMVARFSPPKDQALLVQALRDVGRPFELWFAGDGPLREQVEAEARTAGLESRVQFLGTCRNVPEILAMADIFVLASRYEGLPMSILEAMRAGLPVVASDVGGVREAVEDGVTGLLVPRGDRAGLRERVSALLADPDLRRRLGANGRRRV